MAKIKPIETIENDESLKEQKKHIGNLKLSESKKALKVHIFETNKFYVIPLQEFVNKKAGKIFQYIDGVPDIAGEILPPEKSKNKELWTLKFFDVYYYIQDNYVKMFLNGTDLTLFIWEE